MGPVSVNSEESFMLSKIRLWLGLAMLGWCAAAFAQGGDPASATNQATAAPFQLHYQTGEVSLKNGLAKVQLPEGFRYLPPADAQTVLVKLWGNPPGHETLGMIVPPDAEVTEPGGWAVIIEYREDGYVKDSDADQINYDKLLKEMQAAAAKVNPERKKQGYAEVELVGWATPPRYDKATHKMYWAKELKFSDSKHHTLNYNVRVLGRRGVLVLNTVASMRDFALIERQTPNIVKMAEFNPGQRYADFNGHTDKVAAYGLAALVAGGIAAKAGFFKVLLVGLLAAKKFIIIAFVALAGVLKKLLGRKNASPPSAS